MRRQIVSAALATLSVAGILGVTARRNEPAGAAAPAAPVVGMAGTPDGGGYWLVGADGGVFSYGNARFFGSAGGLHLNAPVVGMAGTPDGGGYWLVGADGGVFSYGNAGFFGAAGDSSGGAPSVSGLAMTPGARGYWLVGADGGILTFGDAGYFGAPRTTIALYGDSLAMEAAPFFQFLTDASGMTALLRAYNGWAICDDLSVMASDAAARHPSVAVIEFSGNAVTPCMAGYTMATTAYYDKYRNDAQYAIDIFRSHGIPVVLIGPPTNAWANLTANVDFLKQIYMSLASVNAGTTYVDAGQAVLANGAFTMTLPCISFEPCTGPAGSNVVRAPDGVHFCPTGRTSVQAWYSICDVYSSGAFRFATALLSAGLGQ